MDGTLTYIGQLPAANLRRGLIPYVNASVWDPVRQIFWTASQGSAGNTPTLQFVMADGTVQGTNYLSGPATTGDLPTDIDFDGGANVVLCCNQRYGYTCNASNVATRIDMGGGAIAAFTSVIYDPSTSKWVAIGYSGGGVPQARTSTDRSTWVAAGNIAGALGAGSSLRMATDKAGKIVVVRSGPSASLAIYTSTNGGTSWSGSLTAITSTNITTGMADARISWVADAGLWFIVTRSSTGNVSEVFTSPDAVSWTLKKYITSGSLSQVASLGTMLVTTYNKNTQLMGVGITTTAYSLDGGATWKDSGAFVDNNLSQGCRQGDGCIAALGSATNSAVTGINVSLRVGLPSASIA